MKDKPKYRPLADRILIRCEEPPKTSKGGIILPEQAKERPTRGEVIAIGPGKRSETGDLIPMAVKVGNIVLYGRYSSDEVPGDDNLVITREDSILAIIE